MQKLFSECPACGGRLIITECRCADCSLQMRGQFQSGQMPSLSDEQMNFIKVFLTARGNLSEVERVLGISYPTIRNKLDEINGALGRGGEAVREEKKTDVTDSLTPAEKTRKEILQRVADGEISPEEAVRKLRGAGEESK
jgi:hypothetical protein